MLRSLRGAFEDFRNALRTAEPIAEAPTAGEALARPPAAPDVAAAPTAGDGTAGGAGAIAEPPPAAARRPRRALWVGAVAVALLGLLAVLRWAPWSPREPADPEVVATYQGGVVTRAELRRKLETLPAEEQRRFRTASGLQVLVGDLVVERTIRQWAQERQLDQREAVKDAMKHATEEIQIADVSEQLHEGRIPVGEPEIQAYFDRNRERFGDRPLVEVRDQIRRLVVEEKEQGFVQDYLRDLRERSNLQVDYSLLDVPEPSEQELSTYYQDNRERFRVPERVGIAQLQVSVSLAGGDDRAKAKAETARARAAAGEDFVELAREFSDGTEKEQGGELPGPVARGSRGQAFDAAVFSLQAGGLSPVFREGDSYYVVKLRERQPERLLPYEEVRAEIVGALRAEREQQAYQERASRTLFSIHGRRTTLGEFLQELDELPPDVRAQSADPASKRKILDSLIERLLVVEDASEQAVDVKRKEEIEHARVDLLARFLHEEEVDSKVRVTDEDVQAEYERNRGHFAEPPRVKVRYIRVSRGTTADADQKARARIDEAAAGLRPAGFLGSGQPADFGELARQYSEDRETAAQGGMLDRWIAESGDPAAELFEHALHEELFPLKVGDVSRILTLGGSYYLFQIVEKQEARQPTFEEARDLVRADLERHKHEELSKAMQRQLLDRTQLQVYDRRLESFLAELGAASGRSR